MNFGLLLIALTSLSTSPLWVRFAQAPATVLCLWRLLGAGFLISMFWVIRGQSLRWASKPEAWFSLTAGIFFFAHLWTYVHAAQTTSVSHLVLIFCSAPLFTALGASLWLKEAFPRRLFAVYALAALGIYLLFNDPLRATSARSLATSTEGDLSALISSILHAFYVLASKKARETTPNLRFSFWLYTISGLLFLLVGWERGEDLLPQTPVFYAAVAGLILFPSFLGHTLYSYLLKFMNINILSSSKLLEPATASLLAFLLFDEEVGPKTLVAFALLGVAVLILFSPWRHFRAKPNPV